MPYRLKNHLPKRKSKPRKVVRTHTDVVLEFAPNALYENVMVEQKLVLKRIETADLPVVVHMYNLI